jgi:hypothetical protein
MMLHLEIAGLQLPWPRNGAGALFDDPAPRSPMPTVTASTIARPVLLALIVARAAPRSSHAAPPAPCQPQARRSRFRRFLEPSPA